MASITQRGDGQFQVRWRPGRNVLGQSCTLTTEPLALDVKRIVEAYKHRIAREQALEALIVLQTTVDQVIPVRVEHSNGAYPPAPEPAPKPQIPTVAEWCDRFIDKKKKRIQPHVLKSYRETLEKHVKPTFGHLRLDEITRDGHILDWVDSLEARLMPRTVHRYHAILHQLLGTAVGKYLTVNPCDREPGDPDSGLAPIQKYDAVFLTKDEAEILVAACSYQIVDMVRFALATGLRWGEIVALRKQEIDLHSAEPKVQVRRARKADGTVNEPKSKASLRTVSLPASIVPALRRRLQLLDRPTDLVFPNPDGGLWNPTEFRRHCWLPALARAQRCPHHLPPADYDGRGALIKEPLAVSTCSCPTRLHRPLRFHDLRHTHVGNLIEAKWNLYAIQVRIGHESIKTTFAIYGHLRAAGDATELSALDALLPSVTPATPVDEPATRKPRRRRRPR